MVCLSPDEFALGTALREHLAAAEADMHDIGKSAIMFHEQKIFEVLLPIPRISNASSQIARLKRAIVTVKHFSPPRVAKCVYPRYRLSDKSSLNCLQASP
jgi:hypothetical protein